MCKTEDNVQLVRDGKAFTFRKTSFWISTGLGLVIIMIGFIISFTTLQLQADTNRQATIENKADINQIKKDLEALRIVNFNLKSLCKKLGVDYIE